MQLQFLSPFAKGETYDRGDGVFITEPVEPIKLYTDNMPGYLGVPRAWGLQHFSHWEMDDRRSLGVPITVAKRPDPNHPRVLDPVAQAKFMNDLKAGLLEYESLSAIASTGSGKTVVALDAAAHLGHRTIILVHLNRLLRQWVGEIESKLGVPRARIGMVQQDTCEWRGKDFVVGLMHSVARRDYGQEFRDAFGTVIVDEAHKAGTMQLSPVLPIFTARHRLILSATLKRKDHGEKIYFMHGGPIRVVSTAAALPLRVYVRDFHATIKLWGNTKGARVNSLTKDHQRNIYLVSIIRQFWLNDRVALIVSDSVMHLQKLMVMAAAAGVPYAKMGQFTGDVHSMVPAIDKATKQPILNKAGEPTYRLKLTKQSQETLDKIQSESQFIFATYGMFTEGIDEPRLDAGLDATPRGDATQLIGRLRRPVPGKRLPVWVTTRDVACKMSMRWFEGRLKDYHATSAEVVYHGTQASDSNGRANQGAQGTVLGGGSQPEAERALPERRGISLRRNPTGATVLPRAS
jgi:superfamily II DNA or RNA helicase